MEQPPLRRAAAAAASLAPDEARVCRLVADLVEAVGHEQVVTAQPARRAASIDFAHLSPLLPGELPGRPADVVVRPRTTREVVSAVRVAHRHAVAFTPRGAGTGNYGQAVPLAAGLVGDLTRCHRIVEIGPGWITAEAGATFVALEAAARGTGQEIAMMPTTVGSTLGGFLAGGAGGIGSIEHGWLWDDFVIALDVVTCPPGAEPVSVRGQECRPYLHAYGVTGIIAAATVRLVPARDWVAVLASFPAGAGAAAARAGNALLHLDQAPRLVSLDEPELTATYPPDDAIPAGRHSLRAIVAATCVETACAIVRSHDGRVEQVREGGAAYLTTLSFNHVTLRARRARPDLCHLQVGGEALVGEPDAIRAAVPGALLHLDGLRAFVDPRAPAHGRQFAGLLLAPFHGAESLYTAISRLEALGVHVVDPHTWLLGGPALPAIRDLAAVNDPHGLLNPGKLPPAGGWT